MQSPWHITHGFLNLLKSNAKNAEKANFAKKNFFSRHSR